MTSTLCKIHVNNSTGVSLNERFTAITTQPKVTVAPARSRSRSVERAMPRVDQATSRANQRLLAELQRKHKLQAAMKLKRVRFPNIFLNNLNKHTTTEMLKIP